MTHIFFGGLRIRLRTDPMQASKGGNTSNAESSNSNSTGEALVHSAMEKREERAWHAVARPWSPQGVTNQTGVTNSADRNASEGLRRWCAESSKDQAYNAVGYVRLYGQEQSRHG